MSPFQPEKKQIKTKLVQRNRTGSTHGSPHHSSLHPFKDNNKLQNQPCACVRRLVVVVVVVVDIIKVIMTCFTMTY